MFLKSKTRASDPRPPIVDQQHKMKSNKNIEQYTETNIYNICYLGHKVKLVSEPLTKH